LNRNFSQISQKAKQIETFVIFNYSDELLLDAQIFEN